jgi:hypothetical protein
VEITELEADLVVFINNCFGGSTSTTHSLELLTKFRAALKQESLQRLLDEKHKIIFNNYGRDVEHIKQLYEEYKDAPILPRNAPIVAGSIGKSTSNNIVKSHSMVETITTFYRGTHRNVPKITLDISIKRCKKDDTTV